MTPSDPRDPVAVEGDGGLWRVTLTASGHPPVVLGPYHNPDLARTAAARLRDFLTALRTPSEPHP
jgi:hypothetical protein